jgi:DNA-binding Lrp family transcriptional regulator
VVSQNLSKLEKEALELIRKEKGILQSTLWKRLGLDSREGSRLVLRLVKKGLVRREQVSVNGRRTYKLFPVEGRSETSRLLIDLTHALKIPCTTCPYFQYCGSYEQFDPQTCPILDRWLDYLVTRRKMQSTKHKVTKTTKNSA